jgi:hypothetical protein
MDLVLLIEKSRLLVDCMLDKVTRADDHGDVTKGFIPAVSENN